MSQQAWSNYFDSEEYFLTCPIAHRINGLNSIIGSSIYIAPGIFVTAKHLVDQWLSDATSGSASDITKHDILQETPFEADVLHIMKNKQLAVWGLRKISANGQSDVAMALSFSSDNENTLSVAEINDKFIINLHPPKIGERITTLGWPETTNSHIEDLKTMHKARMLKSTGVIKNHHFNGAALVKNACVETNANITGGMSGGPAVNNNGELIGMNSSSIQPTDDHDQHMSFISLLWGAFGTKLKIPQFGEITLYQMAKDGYLKVKGLEHIKILEDGNVLWRLKSDACSSCPLDTNA